jgi:hypothetical protein
LVAGVRFELTTFGLCDLTQLSLRVRLYLHPVYHWMSDSTYGQIGYLEQAPTGILGSTLQANVSRRMIQLKFQLQF